MMAPGGDGVRVSVVVCTRNRGDRLLRTLNFYRHLVTSVTWELIIVDNASTDQTKNVLQKFSHESHLNIMIVSEPQPGLARARNRGAAAAQGEIIAFTDDDCYPHPTFVTEIARAYENHEIGYMGGRVLLYDKADLPVTIQLSVTRKVLPGKKFIQSGFIHGANMSFRRSLLYRLERFDERLGAGTRFCSGEDTDLIRRASMFGAVGLYEPNVVVEHHHGRKSRKELNALMNGYARGRGACFMKFIMNHKCRNMYLKNWYWNLRNADWVIRSTEIRSAIAFLIVSRFSRKRAWDHPRESMHFIPQVGLENASD